MVKSVFITGCSSGIGFAAAHGLRDRGYHVITSCRKPSDRQRLNSLGFDTVLLDLDDPLSVERAANEVLLLCNNNLFALFNNAGFGVYGFLIDLSRQQLESQFSTNLFGMHQLTMSLLPAMMTNGDGRIVQMSSIMGLVSTAGRGAYAASKYAVEAWSDALRLELDKSGIKVSIIEPGPIRTSFSANVRHANENHLVQNSSTLQRYALDSLVILPLLYRSLEKTNPKIRYRATLIAQVAAVMKRLMPDKVMDWLLKKY